MHRLLAVAHFRYLNWPLSWSAPLSQAYAVTTTFLQQINCGDWCAQAPGVLIRPLGTDLVKFEGVPWICCFVAQF
jgi:hypothetical protein